MKTTKTIFFLTLVVLVSIVHAQVVQEEHGELTSGGTTTTSTPNPTQMNVEDVRPTLGSRCAVRGLASGPWAGSPCEKLYGPTPINRTLPSPTNGPSLPSDDGNTFNE